jgi:hypothetical protein
MSSRTIPAYEISQTYRAVRVNPATLVSENSRPYLRHVDATFPYPATSDLHLAISDRLELFHCCLYSPTDCSTSYSDDAMPVSASIDPPSSQGGRCRTTGWDCVKDGERKTLKGTMVHSDNALPKIRENRLNVLSNFLPVEFRIWLMAQTWHQVTSSACGV